MAVALRPQRIPDSNVPACIATGLSLCRGECLCFEVRHHGIHRIVCVIAITTVATVVVAGSGFSSGRSRKKSPASCKQIVIIVIIIVVVVIVVIVRSTMSSAIVININSTSATLVARTLAAPADMPAIASPDAGSCHAALAPSAGMARSGASSITATSSTVGPSRGHGTQRTRRRMGGV